MSGILRLEVILLLFMFIGSVQLFASHNLDKPDQLAKRATQDAAISSDSIICPDLSSLDISYFKSYGAAFGEQGNAVVECPNGNVAIGMQLTSPTGGGTVYPGLLLTDPTGAKIFCKKYPDIPHPNATQHVLANEQGFLLAGVSWLMQTDQQGEVLWFKNLEVGTSIWIHDILAVEAGYVIVGSSYTPASSYAEIGCVMIDMDGEPIWSKQILTDNFQLYDLTILPHGTGFMLAGTGKINATWRGILMMELDQNADVVWSKFFDTYYDDQLSGFHEGLDGNFYLTGMNYGLDSQGDVFVIKVDDTGEVIGDVHFDNNNGDEQSRCSTMMDGQTLAISFDHGGSSSRSPAVLSIDTDDFSINWSKSYQYETQFTNYVIDITTALNGGVIMVGDMHVTGKIRDTYLIHTLADGEAGCNTSNYPITEIDKEWAISVHDDYTVSVDAMTTEMTVEAVEAFEITEFLLCESIPPCANFEIESSNSVECESYCFDFTDLAAFSPNTWEWSFEEGSPASYSGSDVPEVCWTEPGQYQIELTVTSEGGEHTFIDFVNVEVYCPPLIPNVFSPNSDGVNDVLQVSNLPSNFTMTIYNRWGDPLFVTVNPGDYWQGRVGTTGEPVSDGVYYYSILDLDNGQNFSGYVQVLR